MLKLGAVWRKSLRLNGNPTPRARSFATSDIEQPRGPKRLKLVKYVVVPGLIGAGVYTVDEIWYLSLLQRSIRAVYGFLKIAYYYGYGKNSFDSTESLHQYAADELLKILMKNKGIYIKLGQAIANQGSVFPIAFQRNFVKLYDDAANDEWESIDKMLKKNLGEDYEGEVFEYIDHKPFASASIAQVHQARLKNGGDDVAVKVQHDYIDKQIVVDLAVYRLISKIYEAAFGIPFTFFTRYISDQLMKETDFEHELQNAEGLRALIDSDGGLRNIYIPKNYQELSTKQVLISEWINGVSLTDKQKLIDQGFSLGAIMNQYLKLFGKQIFEYGFVHSDPHPGNLLVRYVNGKQQLVILDHGLYIKLPEKFKIEYAQLWRYLFELNRNGIKEVGTKWGINSIDLFATLIQLKPTTSPDFNKMNDRRNVNDLLFNFLSDERKFPLELLFLSRTMRMIQNLNQTFGSPVNRINVLTIEATNSLLKNTTNSNLIFWSKSLESWNLIKLKLVLFTSNLVFYFFRIKQILYGDRYGGKGEGIEDYIEHYMNNTARSLGLEIEHK